jgi:hypothetical protein
MISPFLSKKKILFIITYIIKKKNRNCINPMIDGRWSRGGKVALIKSM